MLVMGGITGTPKSFQNQDFSNMSDAMLLNLKNLTWSYLKLWDRHGRPVRFNFHGFSMASELPTSPTNVFIFGGKEVVDSKVASSSKQNPPQPNVYAGYNTFTLNITDGVLTPLKLRDDSSAFMENRFGHMGVSAVSVEVIHQHFEAAAKQRKAEKQKTQRRILDPLKLLPIKVEPLLFTFGGSNIDRGGFCDPILYELVKIQSSAENPYNPFPSMSQSLEEAGTGPTQAGLHVSFASKNGDAASVFQPPARSQSLHTTVQVIIYLPRFYD